MLKLALVIVGGILACGAVVFALGCAYLAI